MASRHAKDLMKRAQRGIFAGRCIMFGNKVAIGGQADNKYTRNRSTQALKGLERWNVDAHDRTRRFWRPNVQSKRVYSKLLDESIKINVTTQAIRQMDYHGGLDKYLLKTTDSKLGVGKVLELKRQLEAALAEKSEAEKAALGLLPSMLKRPGFNGKTAVPIPILKSMRERS